MRAAGVQGGLPATDSHNALGPLTRGKDLQAQQQVHQDLHPRALQVEDEQQALGEEGEGQEGLQGGSKEGVGVEIEMG